MIDINELRRLTQAVIGWSNCNQSWLDQSEDVPAAVVGHIDEDGNTYPIATIDCDQYYAANQSLPLAKFYAAANPAAVSGLIDRLEAAEKERDALRAKVEEMEWQKPAGFLDGNGRAILQRELQPWADLYALPVVAPKLNEIKTALKRALELGQRETWTGARKHRSWRDQREEQQCWNKVWSLLGTKGEEE